MDVQDQQGRRTSSTNHEEFWAEVEVSFDEGGTCWSGPAPPALPHPTVTARDRDMPVTPGEQRESSSGLGLAADGVGPPVLGM